MIIALAFCFSCTNNVWAGNFPVIGTDPVEKLSIVENHSEILEAWARQGLHDAVLMNFDAHDDMRWIRPEKIEKLQEYYEAGAWEAIKRADSVGDESLYDIGSFIYAAAQLGLVREVCWVIPFDILSRPDNAQALKAFLRAYGFPERDIQTFRMTQGRFSGRLHGIPLMICDMDTLPDIEGPLVLSLDLDFLPPFARAQGLDKLAALRTLFEALHRKKYGIQGALMAFSVNGGYLSVLNRWTGEISAAILKNPRLNDLPPPGLWQIWQQLDDAYEANDPDRLLQTALPWVDSSSPDPTILLYTAVAYYAGGNLIKAFNHAEAACRIDSRYCYGLADIGQCLIDTQRLPEALKFFETAYALKPDMNFRQKNLADALKKKGQYAKALAYYEIYQSRNGAFPVQFHIGDTYRLMGEDASALEHFLKALKCLQENPYASIKHQTDADAVDAAIEFFERKGLGAGAKAVREHLGFQRIVSDEASRAEE